MEEFVAVFPSNVQPHIFPENSATHYYTNFENPVRLHGQWQVAVKDVSYVHNIQTIKDESIILGEVRNPQLTFPYLEHANKLITYNMEKHAQELGDETLKNPKYQSDKVEQNVDRYYTIVDILNRIGKNLWKWSYVNDRVCFTYTCAVPNVSYAMYLSADLAKCLGMPKRLFVPYPKLKVKSDLSDARHYASITGVRSCVGDAVTHSEEAWESDKMNITLLPLHRMKKVEFPIPKTKSLDTLIEYIMRKLEPYGLTVRRTLPNDDAALTWVYKHDFEDETHNVAFIYFNSQMVSQLNVASNIVIHPTKFVGRLLEKKLFQNMTITVYLKDVLPPPYSLESWDMVDAVQLPSKYYDKPDEFLRVLNDGRDYTFSFDKRSNRFVINVINRRVVKISERLKTILGFDKSIFFNETHKAVHAPLLDKNIHHFYLYSNIVAPTLVGGAEVPLLRYIPISNAEYGKTVFIEWTNLTYLPVSVSELRQVELALYDDTGERVNFEDGRTVVTLHFKKS